MSKKFGIDISRWQGNFDLSRAKKEDGVEFVIIKGGGGDDGLYVDSKFARNYTEAKQLNLPVGVYWFSKALTVADAKKEAEYFYERCLKGKQFEFPVYIDIEHREQLALPKTLLTDIAIAWCDYIERKGYFVGIYAGKYTFRDNMDDSRLKRFSHWVPQWTKKCTYEDASVLGMWQFGGETNVLRSVKIAGVTCDQNYAYVDFENIIKSQKLNGFANKVVVPVADFKIGDKVKLKDGATFYNAKRILPFVFNATLYIRSDEIGDGNYNISTLKYGAITGRVNKKYLEKV